MQLRRPPPCSYKRGTVVFFRPVERPRLLIHLAFCSPTRGVLQMGNTLQLPERPEKCHNVLLGMHAEYVQRRRCEGIPDKCRALWNSSAPKARRLFGGPNIFSKDRRVSFASNSTLRPSCSHLSQNGYGEESFQETTKTYMFSVMKKCSPVMKWSMFIYVCVFSLLHLFPFI